jgi:toxin ParE1/3/4
MSEYDVSERARRQLRSVIEYSYQKFGRYQADAYLAGFKKSFELLAEFPRMGRAADELRPGLRRYRHQSHYILYTSDDGQVLIRAIIHVRQNLRPELIE